MVIYGIDGNKILNAILTVSAEHEQELSKSDFVRLSWESDVKLTIPAGSYIVPFEDGLKYRLLNAYTPSETDKGFRYDISFRHPLMWLSRVPFLYVENDLKQQEWSFDGLTVTALEYVCKAINEAFGIIDDAQKFTYTLCGTVDGSVSFSVSSNDILSVLSSIAQACKDNNCEWHLSWEHRCLYFGQIAINLGEEVPLLKVHDNIQTASVSESKEDYYNCFYPQGSTKNMSRKAQVGTGNVATLARLGLDTTKYPDGCIYIGTDGKVITKAQFEASNAIKQTLALSFDDIFPHLDLYAYNIRKRTRYLKNDTTGEYELDSNGNKKIYTVWYMRLAYCTTTKDTSKVLVNTTTDNGVTHYWYDYELDKSKQVLQGYTLKGTFKVNTHTTNNQYDALTQSLVGQPSGQDGFELYYHEENNHSVSANSSEGDSGVSLLKGDYEIVMYQSGDIIIPTNEEDGLIPHGKALPDLTCNIVVLFNIVMGEYETKLAQEELAAHTIKEISRRTQDNNNYTARSNAVEFAGKNPKLYIGQKVIYDDGFGYQLSTRVIKLVTKLDYPIIQEITVGNQAIKGTISQLKEDVNNILSGNFSGAGLNSEQVSSIVRNYVDTRFLRKDIADTAQNLITFLDGIALGDGTHGIGGDGAAILKSIASAVFRSGFAGEGFRLWLDELGLANLEVDKLTVRQQMRIFELLIEKIRSIGGHLIVSAANGKVKEVIEEGSMYRLVLEGENMFMADDLIRCQRFTGNNLKSYWVKVSSADSTGILVAKSEFSSLPEAGDDIVLCGNTTNPARQSVISISAAEDGIPRIEVLDKISSKSFSGCLRVRIGSLDNIVDAYYNDMPAEQRPHGYGLYSDNAFLRGVFMLRNGDNIETRFSVVDGKVESMVSATEQGFLSDPWFVKDNGSWTVLPSVLPLTLGGKVIKAGGTNIVMKGGLSGIEMRGTRKVMHISGGSVSQRSDKFRVIPAFELSDGNAIPRAVRLSVMYRCSREGYLTASIHGAVGMGNSHPLYGTAHVDVSDELRQTDFDGLWNGTGDFRISFTGDMDVYGAILTTDMGGDLSNRYRTLFEQDEKILKLVSAIVDGDERLIREMGLVISAGDKSGLYYRDASGKTAFVGIVQDGKVILNGEEIELRGVTVINDKFKVDSNGYLTVTGGTVGGFDIGEDFIGSKSLFILDDKGNITLDENGNKVRDKYGKGMMLDADSIVFGTEFKDDGRSWIYGMHAETGCLAGEAGGVPVGQYLLQKLANVHVGLSTHYNIGTEYDIKGSSVGNLAFCGRGGGVLNGMIDGYGLIVQRYAVNGYVQISPLRDGNRALLIAATSDVRWLLPRLSEVKTLLREDIGYLSDGRTSYDNPFCFSLTLFGHPSAYGSKVYGRTSGQQPPYIFPRLFNVSRQPVEYFELLSMEAVQVWLVYNPFDSTEANRYMAFVK